jgi:phenylalanyl-tRNA synthetase beta chain
VRVPVSWLRELCDPGLPTSGLAERLVMTGTEVARVERVGVPDPSNFVVGRVLKAAPHPNADRLRVCEVDDGSGRPRTIVCGAPNVAPGQTVGVALPGAVMPGGRALGEAELRGVLSSGMILAEDEVGLGDDHAGIMVLPDELVPGAPLAEHLPIAEDVLDLEITPNRPDCLAVYGVARELHAGTGAPLAPDPGLLDAEVAGDDSAEDHVTIVIEDPDLCPRFVGRVFEDVRIGPSPTWLRARLLAAGQRPISNVVDITNYVMLLTGQPMHAFDLDRVRGRRVIVRRARDGERMTTLDGVERVLDPETMVVGDAEGPSSIAGIMGGQISEVSHTTTRVLMEAATWVGPNILRTSSRLGLRSEASARFEKQLHPDGAMAAERVAARLVVELCGARLVPGTLDVYPGRRAPREVALRPARVDRLLGTHVPPAEIEAILARLGFELRGDEAALTVTVPGFRDADVQREADLVEEVARIHGLDRVPATLPARRRAVGHLTPRQKLRRRLEDALRDRGLDEAVNWSFTAPDVLGRLRLGDSAALRLANPLSEDQSVMRPLLLPGLLDVAARNAAHDRPALALFESAHVYEPLEVPEAEGSGNGAAPAPAGGRSERPASGTMAARERHHLGVLLTLGLPGTWRSPERPADFFAAKGVLEGVLGAAAVNWTVEAGERPFLHPGRSATVRAGGVELGWIGELHPLVVRAWDLPGAAAFELDFDALPSMEGVVPAYPEVSTFPAVLQDVAFVVPDEVALARVEEAVRAGGGELLHSARLFDLYRGDQAGAGARSLALRLEFRAPDRTLTDEEVAGLRRAIEHEVAALGGRLRG